MTYAQLQAEQREWSLANFGPHDEIAPLTGIMEEKGELAHALLKSHQGIRGAPEQHREAALDAIGDIMIYMSDLFNCRGWDLGEEVAAAKTYPWRLGEVTLRTLPILDGFLANGVYRKAILLLSYLCQNLNTDLDTVVFSTWEQVKRRNWKQNPQTGEEKKAIV